MSVENQLALDLYTSLYRAVCEKIKAAATVDSRNHPAYVALLREVDNGLLGKPAELRKLIGEVTMSDFMQANLLLKAVLSVEIEVDYHTKFLLQHIEASCLPGAGSSGMLHPDPHFVSMEDYNRRLRNPDHAPPPKPIAQFPLELWTTRDAIRLASAVLWKLWQFAHTPPRSKTA